MNIKNNYRIMVKIINRLVNKFDLIIVTTNNIVIPIVIIQSFIDNGKKYLFPIFFKTIDLFSR